MKKPAMMPLFGDSYLADTTHLSTEEHGAYFLLLLAAWRQADCALPADDRTLANIVRVTPHRWKGMKRHVLAFWRLDPQSGRIYQARQRAEFSRSMERKEAAAAAANERWDRTQNEKNMGENFFKNDLHGDEAFSANGTENIGNDGCERISASNATHTHTHTHIITEEEDEGGGDLFGGELPAEEPANETAIVLETWNAMARANGLATVVKLTDARSIKLRARLRDYRADEITEAIRAVPSRPFLMGEGPRGWKADFDFILRPDTITKIMEGRYAERGERGKRSGWNFNG